VNNDRRRFLNCVAGVTATSFVGNTQASAFSSYTETEQLTGHAFGTQWRLVYDKHDDPIAARQIIVRLINEIDGAISPYKADSLISHFNRSSAGSSTRFPSKISALIRTSMQIADASRGAFDPTVGPIVNRFGFGPIKGSADCTYSDLQITGNELKKEKPGLTLDLCGLGKGFAVEKITSALTHNGYAQFLFELGGEIAAVGQHPSGRQWRVAIEPSAEKVSSSSTTPTVLELDNMCLATSGQQHNQFKFRGQQYGHLINSHTNATALSSCHSVSVLHHNATLADAWSTALFVAGPANGLQLAKDNKLSAYFIFNGSQPLNPLATGLFKTSILKS